MDREAARSWISRCGYPGWSSLVDLVYDRLPPGLRVKQVYQKWAELRFDLDDAASRRRFRRHGPPVAAQAGKSARL